jgi:hypothetical protein
MWGTSRMYGRSWNGPYNMTTASAPHLPAAPTRPELLRRRPLIVTLRYPDEVESDSDTLIEAGFRLTEASLNSRQPYTSIELPSRRIGLARGSGQGDNLFPPGRSLEDIKARANAFVGVRRTKTPEQGGTATGATCTFPS